MTRTVPLVLALMLAGCEEAPPAKKSVRPLPTGSRVRIVDLAGGMRSIAEVPKFVLDDDGWRELLSPLAYSVMRRKATELAYTGRYYKHDGEGIYRCAACGTALFASIAKFDSRTGWPSFTEPFAAENVYTASDGLRDEVLCRRCDSHLGHVFQDGPEPARTRYCMNSAALSFSGAP